MKTPKKVPKNPLGYSYAELRSVLTEDELDTFGDWIFGQTCPVTNRGKTLYYEHDVDRFINIIRHGGVDIWD